MRTYNAHRIYSFKYADILKPEIQFKHIYFRKGKKYVDTFYGERTDNSKVIAIPARLTTNHKDNPPFGFIGDMKEGDFIMGKVPVKFGQPYSIYNGVAYVVVEERI